MVIQKGGIFLVHLRSVQLADENYDTKEYPYNLSFLQDFQSIDFNQSITIIVGENGTGKSTLLEAIATNAESILVGSENSEIELSHKLADKLKLIWNSKTKKGFFFRANEFDHFIKMIKNIKEESKAALKDIEKTGRSKLEAMPYMNTLVDLENLYGEGLEFKSHGESFLDLFKARFRPNSLYILDEPESPLSPINQLALISLILEMVDENCQFIIATHSPILMSLPDAKILSIENDAIKTASYEDLEHVNLTRSFLNDPHNFLRRL